MNTYAFTPNLEFEEKLLSQLAPNDYKRLKEFVQKETKKKLFLEGMTIEDLNAEKNKRLKNHFRYIMQKIEEDYEVNYFPKYYTKDAIFNVVLHNALIPDDTVFLDRIEEARVFGCAPEHVANYLKTNYNLSKSAFNRKITEFQEYKASYNKKEQAKIEMALKATQTLDRNNVVNLNEYRKEKLKLANQPYDRTREKELYYNMK
ncbi:MAG: hypothetical protein PHN72_03465 [Bacilli bacterium]|nr:hypothetical protein [Bacilli bacterium]